MKYKGLKYLPVVLLGILGSCGSAAQEDIDGLQDTDMIIIGGHIRNITETRAYQEEGRVMDGVFNITFTNPDGYEIGEVEFTNGIGYAKRFEPDNTPADLKWTYLATDEPKGSTYSFYMDNLPTQYVAAVQPAGYDGITSVFLQSGHPYYASLFDDKEGSNDLLWGSIEKVSRANALSIDLNHVMSRLCLRVYFDNSQGFIEKKPKKAEVTNLFQTAISFDRLTGNLGHYPNPEPVPFIFAEDFEGWKEGYDEKEKMVYYDSPDFVFPPQEFISNNRPRLTIELTSDQKYTGLFPSMFFVTDDEDNTEMRPMIGLFRGYKLLIRVKISNESPELQFMPVSILKWLDKGEKTITGNQSSVNKEEELEELAAAYAQGKEELFYKWGYKDGNGKWIFNIFKNVNIQASKFAGSMPEKADLPYGFNLYYYGSVVVTRTDGKEITLTLSNGGAEKLKALLSDGIEPQDD